MVERALSSRLIYFCKERLYFECRLSLRSEACGAEAMDGRISPLWPRTNDLDKEAGRPFFYQVWQNILAEFSGRAMLRPKDRLVAMANIASEMSLFIADTYMPKEGMWQRNLHKDLLWYTEETSKGRHAQSGALSWFWSKVNAKIGFVRGATDGELRYPFEKAPLFVIKSHNDDGTIEVTGYVKKFSTLRHIDTDDEMLMEMRKEYPYDLVIEDGEEEEPLILAQGALDLDDFERIISSGKELFYLHVEAETHPTGLILLEDVEGRDQRIGVANVFDFGGELFLDPPFTKFDMRNLILV